MNEHCQTTATIRAQTSPEMCSESNKSSHAQHQNLALKQVQTDINDD